jgi:Tol biopolymer transport system component
MSGVDRLPELAEALDRLVPLDDGSRPDWEDVVARAEFQTAGSRARTRVRSGWFETPIRVVPILASLAITVAVVVFAIGIHARRVGSSAGPTGAPGHATNGAIAFSAPVHGRDQVFTVNPDGTGLRQVTHLSAGQLGVGGVSWSPDGRSLLYSVGYRHGPDAIFTSLADGSGATRISPPCTGACLGDDNPVYSPDGLKIAFERAFGPIVNNNASGVAVFTMNADGSDLTRLSPATATNQQPQWSPDGTKIAFVHTNAQAYGHAIEVMNADGGNVRRFTPIGIDATDPRWSPDGKRLVFSNYADPVQHESANLFTMHANGTDRVQLTHYSGGTPQAFADGWSPDGTQIVYHLYRFSGCCTEVGGFYIINVRTKRVRRLTHVRITSGEAAAWGRKPG